MELETAPFLQSRRQELLELLAEHPQVSSHTWHLYIGGELKPLMITSKQSLKKFLSLNQLTTTMENSAKEQQISLWSDTSWFKRLCRDMWITQYQKQSTSQLIIQSTLSVSCG